MELDCDCDCDCDCGCDCDCIGGWYAEDVWCVEDIWGGDESSLEPPFKIFLSLCIVNIGMLGGKFGLV